LHRGFTPSAVAAEIDHGQEVLRAELGVCPKLYRPPWLARTPTLFRLLEPRALVPVSGTFCHPLEPAQPSAERIAARAIARTRPGSIIIFHDGYNARTANRSNTLRAVAIVIESLRARGFALTTVDRLLGVAPYGRGFDRSVAH
jgi:peptidoglycan/xylan/chitin deacetylase (PgdA/CDA1 family)